ncbi:MAG: ankyrin repeat domain-containing protein [Verrucomicrobiota bacterium]|nr:ankyrin repeat domain-containing protein [Verrucomicrobiota bacterium]
MFVIKAPKTIAIGAAFGAVLGVPWGADAGSPAESDQSKALARLELLGLPLEPSALSRVVATRDRALIDLCLTAGLDVNGAGPLGRSPLHVAVLSRDWELARRLLAWGAKAESADDCGMTPLMVTAFRGHLETLRALLEQGARPESADAAGRTAVHYAVAARGREMMLALLDRTPGLDRPCADGRDLLELAFDSGDWEIVCPILERSAPLPSWSSAAQKALTRALQQRDVPRAKLLLRRHAVPPTPEGRNQPLLAYAVLNGNATLCDLLLEAGASPNTVLSTPVEKEFVDLLSGKFLRHYVEHDHGVTVLMLAAGQAHARLVKSLLAKGAASGAATRRHKMVALYFASRTESPETQQLLIAGAPAPEKLRVEISLTLQEAVLYQNGTPLFKTGISTGRTGFTTPAGQFVVSDKQRDHRSTIYKVPMPYFLRLSCRDFGMHEGYVSGAPESHGCIRLPPKAARRLFKEVPIGTLVTIR